MRTAVVSSGAVPPGPSDAQLIERFVRGDPAGLDALFARYREVAYRVAYRLLGNEADALDAVQDGFVNALRNLDRFRGHSSFKTWLLRIVSNASLDLGRSRRRRETLAGEIPADDPEPLDPLPPPDAGLERADLRRMLNQALAVLPPLQRQTFVLHVEGDLTYREVAEVLGISVGTVMSRLYYARQRLKTELAEYVLT